MRKGVVQTRAIPSERHHRYRKAGRAGVYPPPRQGWLGWLAWILVGIALPAPAQPGNPADRRSIDLVLALDLSGSMGVNKARYTDMFSWVSNFGQVGDRIGVVAFGSSNQVLEEMKPFEQFKLAPVERALTQGAKYTDLAAGLEQAYYVLKRNVRPGAAHLILLFSDGRIDLPGGVEAAKASERYLREVLLSAMINEKIQMFAFVPKGLSGDYLFLHELTEKTGGDYSRGLPENPGPFRRQYLANLELSSRAAQPASPKALERAQPSEASLPRQESATTKLVVVIVIMGVIILAFILWLVILVIRPSQQARKQSKALASVLSEVQSLRSNLKAPPDGTPRPS